MTEPSPRLTKGLLLVSREAVVRFLQGPAPDSVEAGAVVEPALRTTIRTRRRLLLLVQVEAGRGPGACHCPAEGAAEHDHPDVEAGVRVDRRVHRGSCLGIGTSGHLAATAGTVARRSDEPATGAEEEEVLPLGFCVLQRRSRFLNLSFSRLAAQRHRPCRALPTASAQNAVTHRSHQRRFRAIRVTSISAVLLITALMKLRMRP